MDPGAAVSMIPVLVFGPAYLDRVVRVDRSLVDPSIGDQPLDGSVDGAWGDPADSMILIDPIGSRIVVAPPPGWTGRSGLIRLSRALSDRARGWSRTVRATSWQDDLGGMGAGYAAALGGELVSVLGPEADPTSQTIARLLERNGITHHPVRSPDQPADWTLLITSGEHGDKLPIGFRGCHASAPNLGPWTHHPSRLRVVAALPNRLAEPALRGPASIRFFAPSLRNMQDLDPPIARFADSVDILACNRGEWESLVGRDEVAHQVSILIVTDGPRGAIVRFTSADPQIEPIEVPAFPRAVPPQDTNRAGEAFASEFLATLLRAGWTPGVTPTRLIERAAARASAASSIVLDRTDFGFGSEAEVDRLLAALEDRGDSG